MPRGDAWLAANWPFVRSQLPPAPADVVELGCGSLGGFVPSLLDAGYRAVGVDPDAPEEPPYRRVPFEEFDGEGPVDAVVASNSLHHLADLGVALDRVGDMLVPGGTVVVVEWATERWDEATARWVFDRLPPPDPGAEPGWLHHARDRWEASGQPWEDVVRAWVEEEGLHPGERIVAELDRRFEREFHADGPYFFTDLPATEESDEQAAIDAGLIRATGIRYAGRRR